MKFPCTVTEISGGQWQARCTAPLVGTIEITTNSRSEALKKISAEIRYCIELCPCSGVPDQFVELEIRSTT